MAKAKFPTLVATLLLFVSPALAGVNVKFVNPVRYIDSDSRTLAGDQYVLQEIEKHLKQLGNAYLRPDQTLNIEVLNIDLAGEREPIQGVSGQRILRGGTPPNIRLRYTLTSGGRVISSGEESVTDNFYQSNISASRSNDRLAFEKAMLTDWFASRFRK